MPNLIGLITARGGSKGISRKNLRPLAGRPLIAWTIDAALCSNRLSHVMVSTDDAEIAAIARQWGAEVPFMRPPELARDDSSHIDVVLHALGWLELHGPPPDGIMTLQPTSPLRRSDDIDAAVRLADTTGAEAVVSVTPADCHPYLCMRVSEQGALEPFIDTRQPYRRRQDFPEAFCLNGAIYLNSRESLISQRTLFPPGTLPYVMPAERSLDIDTPSDFRLAETILGAQDACRVA